MKQSAAKRKRGVDESSDFEPALEEEKEDEEMSDDDQPKGDQSASEDSGSGSGRRSARIRAKTRNRSRRHSDSSDQDSVLDADELAEEAQELAPSKRRRLNRNLPDGDLAYDKPARRNRARNQVDYRIVRPELNAAFDDEGLAAAPEKSRSRGGNAKYRPLFSNQGPFGGGLEGGAGGGMYADDSDSSDEEVQKMPKAYGGAVGIFCTSSFACSSSQRRREPCVVARHFTLDISHLCTINSNSNHAANHTPPSPPPPPG